MFPSLNDDSRYQVVDLSTGITEFPSGKEIYRTLLKGRASDLTPGRFENVIESILDQCVFLKCDFTNTDFKDCTFKKSLFEECTFNILTFATVTISDCAFESCTFADSTFQNCVFYRARFSRCNLAKLLIKECQFIDCVFEHCKTSNKLLELSLLVNTRFVATDIQVDTILSNFGLCASHLDRSRIRSGRADASFVFITQEKLREAALNTSVSVPGLVPLRIDFFDRGGFMAGSAGLDRALKLETWIQVSSNLGSFLQVYRAFSDFLVLLYENDGLYWQALLKLHDLSSVFVSKREGLPFETTTTLLGIHQQLSIYIEQVLVLAAAVADDSASCLELLVKGPTTAAEVQDILWPLFPTAEPASITRLEPQNSPWHLSLDFISQHHCFRAVVLLLATRVKAQIREVAAAQSQRSRKGSKTTVMPEEQEMGTVFDVGLFKASQSQSEYGISVLIPGNRIADFRLDFDSKQLSKMAAFLIGLNLFD